MALRVPEEVSKRPMEKVFNENTVTLRPFRLDDIDAMCDYWYRSPREFIESMQVVPEKMVAEDQLRQKHEALLRSNQTDELLKVAMVVIEYQGTAVGMHSLVEIEFGQQGVFHAHIWQPELRRCGLASYTYPRACKYFMQRFHLKKIIFKTLVRNPGPNRVKQKMGIMPLAEVEMEVPFMAIGTKAFLYEISPDQIDEILLTGRI